MATPAPRVVFLDIDGTLVDHAQHLPDSAVAAVRGARAAGHRVYLCTGRARASILPHVLQVGFDGVISAGGGFVESDGALLISRAMAPADVQTLVSFFTAHDLEYTLQAFDDAYPSAGLLARMRPILQRESPDPRVAAASAERLVRLTTAFTYRGAAPTDTIAKATFLGRDASAYRLVRDGLGERFHVITGSIPYLDSSGGEVSLRGMNKGTSITLLLERLGVPVSSSIAIGDSMNDIEMLQTVGVGIAMGDAAADVRAIADEVTGTVVEDGVWAAFARHGLLGR
jgi:Cof subfamily protein (haloacid dehalogenase superfamily)